MRKLILIGFTVLLLLLICQAAIAAPAKGIISGDAAGSVTIIRDGQILPFQKGELLYEGDILRGVGIDSAAVEWHPYAALKRISDTESKVIYEPPGAADIAINKLKEFLGFAERENRASYAATRGEQPTVSPEAQLLPGFKATALPGTSIVFAWGDAKGRNIIVENSKKEVIFKRSIVGQRQVALTPEEIGLRAGEGYTWRIDGSYDVYQIALADNGLTRQVATDLQKIESAGGSMEDIALGKAAYLQILSDSKAGQVDLYWLSYLSLKAINASGDPSVEVKISSLKQRFNKHLEATR